MRKSVKKFSNVVLSRENATLKKNIFQTPKKYSPLRNLSGHHTFYEKKISQSFLLGIDLALKYILLKTLVDLYHKQFTWTVLFDLKFHVL